MTEPVDPDHRVKERANQLATEEWGAACREFDEMWPGEHDNCGGWTTSGPPCGGCYECVLAQTLHHMPSWTDYIKRAQLEIKLEAAAAERGWS